MFSTNERINTSMLAVELLQGDKRIQKFNVNASLIADNAYLILRLNQRIEGRGQAYILKITSDAEAGNGVTLLGYCLQYSTFQHRDGYKLFVVLFGTVILVCFASWIFVIKKQMAAEKTFLVLWCAFSLAYICFNTMYNVPDESHHFYRAYEISMGHMVSEMNEEGTMGGRDLPLVDTGFSPRKWQSFAETLDARLSEGVKFFGFSNTALYAPVSYVPQAAGIFVARIVTDRIAVITYAGRFANWLCITVILYLSMGLVPYGKEFLAIVLLMPMNMHEAFSLAPDGMVMAISAFMIAFVYVQKTRLTWRQTVLIYAMAVFISMYKIVYLPFCLLYLLIPKERFGNIKTMAVHAVIVASCTILLSVIWLKSCNKFLTHIGANSSLQIANILHHPLTYGIVVFRTYSEDALMLLQQMAGSALGQLKIGTNSVLTAAYIILIFYKLIVGIRRDNDTAVYEAWIYGLVIFAIILLTSTSIYVQWSSVGENKIIGLQGRYYIPLLFPAYFMFSRPNEGCGKIKGKECLSFVSSGLAMAFNICSGIAILFYCLE